MVKTVRDVLLAPVWLLIALPLRALVELVGRIPPRWYL